MKENIVQKNAREQGLTVIAYLDQLVGMCGTITKAARQLNISRQRLYQIMVRSGAVTQRKINISER